MRTVLSAFFVMSLGILVSCSGPRTSSTTDPDLQFGHRYEGNSPDGYSTITISIPQEDLEFSYFPATFDRVIVRPETSQIDQDSVAVEILVKGSLPDACMELHAFNQKRAGHLITATLEMRRAQSGICATVSRPYRLYLILEGGFVQGHYTLKLNDATVPFVVRPFESS